MNIVFISLIIATTLVIFLFFVPLVEGMTTRPAKKLLNSPSLAVGDATDGVILTQSAGD